MAAKRGQRLDWVGFERYFSHSREPGVIKWNDSSESEIDGAKASSKGSVIVNLDKVLEVVPAIDPMDKKVVLARVMRECGIGDNKADLALAELAAEGKIHTRSIPNPSGRGRSIAGWSKTPEPVSEDAENDAAKDAVKKPKAKRKSRNKK